RRNPHGARAHAPSAPGRRRARGQRAGEPLTRRRPHRGLCRSLRPRGCPRLVVAGRGGGAASSRDGRARRPRCRARARRAARAAGAARLRHRRAGGDHRRAGGAPRIRRPSGVAAGDLGRVPDSLAVRACGPGVRRHDVDRPRRRSRARAQGARTRPGRGDRRGRPAGERLMYALYTAIAFVGLVTVFLPAALARRLTRGVPLNARARLGREGPRAGEPTGWVHAVSVGEAIAAAPLVEGLRRLHPELPLVMTPVTSAGAQIVRERFAGLATHRFFPLDFPSVARRAVASINPAFLICMETELWPNTLRALASGGVPVMVANGRISDRSYRRYRLIRRFMASVLANVRIFAMQSDEDARRIIALGAHPERVVVTGNIKVDASVADPSGSGELWRRLLALAPSQRVWVAGSTHPGEEGPVLDAHRAALDEFPELVLVIAPRHPERTREVQALLERRGWPSVRRGELPAAVTNTAGPVPPVVLLATVGELAMLYSVAGAVFVGGSLVPMGGHNVRG